MIAIVAGMIAGISPCIVPVLPVIFTAGLTPGPDGIVDAANQRRRALATVSGLIVSFVMLTLFGAIVLSAIGLPIDLQSTLGPILIVLVGVSLISSSFAELIERPFRRLAPSREANASASGLVLGMALGAVFVPCAGPVLAAISIAATTKRFSPMVFVVTCAFGVGLAIPLATFALSGPLLARRLGIIRLHGQRVRIVSGLVLIAMAIALWAGSFAGFQRALPPYVASIDHRIEGSPSARALLSGIAPAAHRNQPSGDSGSLVDCVGGAPSLQHCGTALPFDGIAAWRNTNDNQPLSLARLAGKVVLLDFWTYSCINCQRALPHLEAWARRYGSAGLVVVGVHTPEFAFERDPANVTAFVTSAHLSYPVALDSNATTWGDYLVNAWPTTFLIDAHGMIRHVDDTEGGYAHTEVLLRSLLRDAHPNRPLPRPTELVDATPSPHLLLTREFHFGSGWTSPYVNALIAGSPFTYTMPKEIPAGSVGLGGTWDQEEESITAHARASFALNEHARNVYLVVGGTGRLGVTGSHGSHGTRAIDVSGPPHLVTLARGAEVSTSLLKVTATPGLSLYAVTFG